MPNAFYQHFDHALQNERRSDYRSPFQQDRDRLIHTSAFRRLQGKTQVFLAGEYDFYRTRLTHSIEVAQIARSICAWLQQHSDALRPDYFIDPDLVEVVSLAHDLGHPPFGHAGEASLNQLLHPWGGFEGNAQSLRLITETIYSSAGQRSGLSPTRAFMDGILKYKALRSDVADQRNHFLYDDQAEHLAFVLDTPWPDELQDPRDRNDLKSIECQIMDWADDTAYSTNDLADGINAGFITIERAERWAANQKLSPEQTEALKGVFHAIRNDTIERHFGRCTANFVQATRLEPWHNFMRQRTQRYTLRLQVDPAIRQQCQIFKKLALDLVFRSPQISQLEYKGHLMLCRMFEALMDNYARPRATVLLPETFDQALRTQPHEAERARLIGDYLAGMTDRYLLRTYRRMFEPDFGSIVDLVQ